MSHQPVRSLAVCLAVLAAGLAVPLRGQRPDFSGPERFRFTGGVDFVTVHATVTDASGRFVSSLRKEDFAVFEDGQPVDVTYFTVERVPVSLGLVLDTSGSMEGDKIKGARRALEGLLGGLVDSRDEVFLYRFSDFPILVQEWTTDRRLIDRALDRVTPTGGTAMYDAVASAIPLVETGRNPKKVLLVVSDGHDTSSTIETRELKQRIRESDALVYAVGIDGEGTTYRPAPRRRPRQPPRLPVPGPFGPGILGRGGFLQLLPGAPGGGSVSRGKSGDPANVAALRDLTDDSGGRTDVIGEVRQLEQTMAGIADELGRQYFLGYSSPAKRDGEWHAIRVDVQGGPYRVRARRGYVAN